MALTIREPGALLKVLAAYDGRSDALLILSGELAPDDAQALAADAEATAVVSDRPEIPGALSPDSVLSEGSADQDAVTRQDMETRWIMTTSGTTGRPKMVNHTLAGLARTVRPTRPDGLAPVWGLTYAPTCFAGLQVVLQAVLGGGRLVAPPLSAPIGDRLAGFAAAKVTHLSATPTLWRHMLMHPSSAKLPLRQITLGGEIVDQALLDTLRARFPNAKLTHIYASTETGVGFSVKDGLEGFPASWLNDAPDGIALRITGDTLWIRVRGTPSEYLGPMRLTRDADGFVDTLDRVGRQADRVVFLGRDTGVVNVGGVKVYPETVERVLNASPAVAACRVIARKNPISGEILVAEVVPMQTPENPDTFKAELIKYCRTCLPPAAVPALVRLADRLDVNSAGKLSRS
ncbi:MAG: AMP-binding protein [Proteobacteria bacterium]|nr:AMP-binding protein [Pseudomonadota bacterium]